MRCRCWRLPASRRVRETALQELRSKRLEGFLECSFPAGTATRARDFQSNGLGFLTREWVAIIRLVVQGENFRSSNTLARRRPFHFHIQVCFPKASPNPFPSPLGLPFTLGRGGAGANPIFSNSAVQHSPHFQPRQQAQIQSGRQLDPTGRAFPTR